MSRTLLLLAAWAIVVPNTASAQAWYDSIIPEKAHDFGTVARGSKLKHSFKLVNTTSDHIHILETRAKCGCTEIKLGARDVPPGTQTVIEATLDTTKFVGYKPSGLTVVLDRPVFQEIDLNMTCFIRGDVLLNPGVADFGVVARGSSPKLTLALTYAGGVPNWQVTKVHTIGEHVHARVAETSRAGGQAQYTITVTLDPSAPVGYFKDEITLLTNDQGSPSIPISVAAQVQAAVSVLPSILNLNYVKAGSSTTRDVIVRSAKPFKITEARSKGGELTASKPTDAEQTMHRLKVTLKAPAKPGPFNAVLEVGTTLKDEPPARLTVFATVQ